MPTIDPRDLTRVEPGQHDPADLPDGADPRSYQRAPTLVVGRSGCGEGQVRVWVDAAWPRFALGLGIGCMTPLFLVSCHRQRLKRKKRRQVKRTAGPPVCRPTEIQLELEGNHENAS